MFGEVIVRLEEDLRKQIFLAIQPGDSRYYEQTEPLFGIAVHESFPSTRFDISEAGKCLALHRGTGCVFHLMRALEVSLRVVRGSFLRSVGSAELAQHNRGDRKGHPWHR